MDGELAILAGRLSLLVERARAATSIAGRRYALDMLARGLLHADPGTVSDELREQAAALNIDPSTLAATDVPRLPHAVGIPLVDRTRGVGFVRQVHVTYDPAGLMGDGLLSPQARHAASVAIRAAAGRVHAPRPAEEHVLVAAQPVVLRDARVDGSSLAAAALVSAFSLWTGRPVRPERVVTGAIASERVVAVGEIQAKVEGAREQGADAILVPGANVEEARRHAGDALSVVGVQTIDDLLSEALLPAVVSGDAEAQAEEAKALSRTGWNGYRWPSVSAQLARISATLPEQRVDLRVDVLTRLGAAHRHSGDPVGCRQWLAEALAIVDSEEGQRAVPDAPRIDLWIQVAMTERQLCRFQPAALAAKKSVAVARRARLRGSLVKALGTAGLVAMSRRRVPDAIALFRESLANNIAHTPSRTARSRAYLIEALGRGGHTEQMHAELTIALDEAQEPARASWVRTSAAAAFLALDRPGDAVNVLTDPAIEASLLDEPLPGLLARRRLGIALIRDGEAGRGFEMLASSPLVHGRALAPHLSFLAHVNVLHEARERIVLGAWNSDIAGRAEDALTHLPRYGAVPAFLGRALSDVTRTLTRQRPPPCAGAPRHAAGALLASDVRRNRAERARHPWPVPIRIGGRVLPLERPRPRLDTVESLRAAVSPDTLFGHLCVLRDAADVNDPRLAAHWRGVHTWLLATFPGGGAADDRRQETLLSLLRAVGGMRAETPLAAAKWVSTIHKRKRVDALRAVARNPVDVALASAPRDPEMPSVLDRIEAAPEAPPREALGAVVTMVLERVHRVLERDVKNPRKRALRRVQAQAAMLRLVCGWDAETIAEALDHGEPIGRDRLYKWVERGRAPVLAALDDWEATDDPDEREALAPMVEALREMFETRRADAGRPRLDRRREPS